MWCWWLVPVGIQVTVDMVLKEDLPWKYIWIGRGRLWFGQQANQSSDPQNPCKCQGVVVGL